MEYSTEQLNIRVSKCESLAEFKADILPQLKEYRAVWKKTINGIFRSSGLSKSGFAALTGVTPAMVSKWLLFGAVPRNRETFIKIGLASGAGLEGINALLLKNGFPELYARSIEDCVYIFVLSSDSIPHTYRACTAVRMRLMALLEGGTLEAKCGKADSMDTDMLQRFLVNAETEQEIVELVRRNHEAFSKSYDKLYSFISERIDMNVFASGSSERTVNALSEIQGWSSSLLKCAYEIRKRRWFPTRAKLISLGLHLNMGFDELNEMLRLSHMDALYTKNPVECAVAFAVQHTELNDAVKKDGRRDLCNYCLKVLRALGIDDSKALIEELRIRY